MEFRTGFAGGGGGAAIGGERAPVFFGVFVMVMVEEVHGCADTSLLESQAVRGFPLLDIIVIVVEVVVVLIVFD